jgi:acyl phosphate:glycerol-3-phosphate acyltransferase
MPVDYGTFIQIKEFVMISVLILAVIAYLIGSLSSAIIVCKFMGLPDPRSQGSYNPGTTNVLRIAGKGPALITLVGDMLKGFIPVFIAHIVGVQGFLLGVIAFAAFIGHVFPIFFKFQGGKGVATACGAILALSPFVGFLLIIIWVAVASVTRYSSLAAVIGTVASPILILIFSNPAYFLPMLIIAIVLLFNHRNNIQRLRAGTESKINF